MNFRKWLPMLLALCLLLAVPAALGMIMLKQKEKGSPAT